MAGRCFICGIPATGQFRQLIEIEPVKDEHGDLWRQFEEGEIRDACAFHLKEENR